MKNNIRVGLLAYGAIGHEHNVAVQGTEGLELTTVCDTNPDRVKAALELAPNAAPFNDATAMLPPRVPTVARAISLTLITSLGRMYLF